MPFNNKNIVNFERVVCVRFSVRFFDIFLNNLKFFGFSIQYVDFCFKLLIILIDRILIFVLSMVLKDRVGSFDFYKTKLDSNYRS